MSEHEDECLICDRCGKPIDPDEELCWGHEPDCLNYGQNGITMSCDCDVNYHTECCPICNPKVSP